MARVIVFGTTDTAQLAEYYLRTDSEHEVVAFTVDGEFQDRDTFEGRPVVPFEDLVGRFSPDDVRLFTPMVALQMNKVRQRVYLAGKAKGYRFVNYISSRATVLTDDIGENNFILEDNTIQPFQRIGDNNVLWSGNHIGHHGRIGSHVLFTSHVVLSGHCDVRDNCFFGVNATIRDGITLGEGTLVAMGASILKNTEPWSAWIGNPARKHAKTSLELYR
jgi:sugar O-acyltransferase (sialic acid O-acetyltransferase NeuD family)